MYNFLNRTWKFCALCDPLSVRAAKLKCSSHGRFIPAGACPGSDCTDRFCVGTSAERLRECFLIPFDEPNEHGERH
jgi:hypothetical protein